MDVLHRLAALAEVALILTVAQASWTAAERQRRWARFEAGWADPATRCLMLAEVAGATVVVHRGR